MELVGGKVFLQLTSGLNSCQFKLGYNGSNFQNHSLDNSPKSPSKKSRWLEDFSPVLLKWSLFQGWRFVNCWACTIICVGTLPQHPTMEFPFLKSASQIGLVRLGFLAVPSKVSFF